MNIKFKRKAENEEMAGVYEFLTKNKNLLISVIVLIALIVISVNLYKKSAEKTSLTAADKLFEISQLYEEGKYEEVASRGKDYVDKYSGYQPAGDILIFTSRSLLKQDRVKEAVELLEDNKNAADNGPFKFAVYNLLGGMYMDLWLQEKNSDLAEKAGKYYLKAAETDRELHKDNAIYNAGNSFVQAGKTDKAKDVLKPLYERSNDLEYQLKQKVIYLYENIN